ncbi:TIGR00659 family protein [Ruminobacter amylophilus]|jgi:predicted murein hydrolase (TIGR00659 family)|uniref:TIGR00659 family protein n=1 Tax=Ruminobacter amylophilus TaxID=867 RepID=A0A662ZIE9_9GAMM|nr:MULTISPECIES: LrgB family protein [Ruminobacter]SFP32499.1 TIGR00659 family protein [Ruminobacter amylophilus]
MDYITSFFTGHQWMYYVALPLSVGLFFLVRAIQMKTRWSILNPLLIPVIIIVSLILLTGADPKEYQDGTSVITWLLEPCIVALAIPLYLKFKLIKSQAVPILICCTVSILISFVIAYVSCHLMGVNQNMIPTLGARSITTPLAMDVSDRLGGISSITACIVCGVGILGAVIGFPLMKLFHVRNPKAQGLAIGACAHAVGTSAANEQGETQGAYSSLSLIVCGVMTTFLATPIFMLLNFLDTLFNW